MGPGLGPGLLRLGWPGSSFVDFARQVVLVARRGGLGLLSGDQSGLLCIGLDFVVWCTVVWGSRYRFRSVGEREQTVVQLYDASALLTSIGLAGGSLLCRGGMIGGSREFFNVISTSSAIQC